MLGLRSLRRLPTERYRSVVRALSEATGESVSLGLVIADEIVLVARHESQHRLRVPDAELRGVTKVFGQTTIAVDAVSLAVERGEFFSLLGPSGCGKTTTLRIVAGLELPTAGEVLIRGERMGRRPAHRRPTNTIF